MRPERPIDLDLLLEAWAAPSPRAGFADRVLAACDAPVRPRAVAAPSRARRAGVLLWAALAAAVIVAPLFFVHHLRSASRAPSVAVAADPDLGIERD